MIVDPTVPQFAVRLATAPVLVGACIARRSLGAVAKRIRLERTHQRPAVQIKDAIGITQIADDVLRVISEAVDKLAAWIDIAVPG